MCQTQFPTCSYIYYGRSRGRVAVLGLYSVVFMAYSSLCFRGPYVVPNNKSGSAICEASSL